MISFGHVRLLSSGLFLLLLRRRVCGKTQRVDSSDSYFRLAGFPELAPSTSMGAGAYVSQQQSPAPSVNHVDQQAGPSREDKKQTSQKSKKPVQEKKEEKTVTR